jgi:hypothetical protein
MLSAGAHTQAIYKSMQHVADSNPAGFGVSLGFGLLGGRALYISTTAYASKPPNTSMGQACDNKAAADAGPADGGAVVVSKACWRAVHVAPAPADAGPRSHTWQPHQHVSQRCNSSVARHVFDALSHCSSQSGCPPPHLDTQQHLAHVAGGPVGEQLAAWASWAAAVCCWRGAGVSGGGRTGGKGVDGAGVSSGCSGGVRGNAGGSGGSGHPYQGWPQWW